MRNILYGLILIGIGFLLGGSIFLGDLRLAPVVFDGIGVVLILWGVVTLIRRKQIKA